MSTGYWDPRRRYVDNKYDGIAFPYAQRETHTFRVSPFVTNNYLIFLRSIDGSVYRFEGLLGLC